MPRTGTGQIVNRTGLAECFGVNLTTVDQWRRKGCPVVSKGSKGRAWEFNTAAVMKWRLDQLSVNTKDPETETDKALRRRLLVAQVQSEELDLATKMKLVVPIEEAQLVWSQAFAEIRANFRTLPQRVVTRIVGETDETKIKLVLGEEIDQVLTGLAESDYISLEPAPEVEA